MNFKKLPLFVLFMCSVITSSVKAQNRLEPYTTSIFDSYDEHYHYLSSIRKILFEDVHPEYTPFARYIVVPSFKCEYVLSFDYHELPKYHLTLTKPKQSIWYTRNESNLNIEIIKIQKEIDSSDMKLIVALIEKSIKQSKVTNHSGYDGTNYFFTNSQQTAKIWSPKTNTKTYHLIEIMNEIIKLVESEEKTIKFSPELVKRIKKLNR